MKMMYRFAGLQSFGQAAPGGVIAQSGALEKTDPMAGYGMPPSTVPPLAVSSSPYLGPDPYSAAAAGVAPPPPLGYPTPDPYAPLPPMGYPTPDPYAALPPPGNPSPDPYGPYGPYGPTGMSSLPPLVGAGEPLSAAGGYGMPPPGSNADPYAMSSFAPGTSAPEFYGSGGMPSQTPSSAFTDPYAPGGALASSSLPLGTSGATTLYGRGTPNSAAGRAIMRGAHPFGIRPIPSPPKGLPSWFKWVVGGVLLVFVIAIVVSWLRKQSPSSPPHPVATPPSEAANCPPTPSCPPAGGDAPPQRREEVTLRLPKDDRPLVVKIQDDRRGEGSHNDDDDRRRDEKTPDQAVTKSRRIRTSARSDSERSATEHQTTADRARSLGDDVRSRSGRWGRSPYERHEYGLYSGRWSTMRRNRRAYAC